MRAVVKRGVPVPVGHVQFRHSGTPNSRQIRSLVLATARVCVHRAPWAGHERPYAGRLRRSGCSTIPRAGTSAQAIGIAERLGVPFRRIPLSWNWMAHVAALSRRGSLIGLAAPPRGVEERAQPWSAARRARGISRRPAHPGDLVGQPLGRGRAMAEGAVRLRRRALHETRPWRPAARPRLRSARHPRARPARARRQRHVRPRRPASPIAPHAESGAKRHGRSGWRTCRIRAIALLVGGPRDHPLLGPDLSPALAHTLGRQVARIAAKRGGAVLATTSRRTGKEATEALGGGTRAGDAPALSLGRAGREPLSPAFLRRADAIIVTADSVSMISEACATAAPVFIALPDLAGPRHKRMIAAFERSGQVKPFAGDLVPWRRTPLDEAGRVSREILRRFPLD